MREPFEAQPAASVGEDAFRGADESVTSFLVVLKIRMFENRFRRSFSRI